MSRNKAIEEARKLEHRGMTQEQIAKYEGALAAFSKYGQRKDYVLK